MKLKPSIASYNSNGLKARKMLNKEYIDVITKIALEKTFMSEIEPIILKDLIEMHVLKDENGKVQLDTAVFLEDDIRKIQDLANDVGSGLAEVLVRKRTSLMEESPEIRNFLAAVISVTQGLSQYVYQNNLGSEWKEYTGEFEKTKIDFDEECMIGNSIGEHLLKKSIVVGEKYTAVFIGPGGRSFGSAFSSLLSSDEYGHYGNGILKYLTDSYGMLIEGESNNESLMNAAESVGIFLNGKPKNILITKDVYNKHSEAMNVIKELSSNYYASQMSKILEVLSETTSGKQGVNPDSMLMHFWRYFSRVLAKKLYEHEFLTDNVLIDGCITVFFKNDIEELRGSFQ